MKIPGSVAILCVGLYLGIQIGIWNNSQSPYLLELHSSLPTSSITDKRWSSSHPDVIKQAFKANFLSFQGGSRRGTQETAIDIMKRSYDKTYALLEGCPRETTLKTCIVDLYKAQNVSSNLPWWFRTLLRDGSTYILHGDWHNLTLAKNAIEVCAIEKVGSTEWREVSCEVNKGLSKSKAHYCKADKKFMPKTVDKIVFLRDPLTRFLSAFINKCVSECHYGRPCRVSEKHCEPERLFAYYKEKNDNSTHRDDMLIDDFVKDRRLFFQAYVELVALKWNVHFYPQSLYCNGLYRTIHEYDFVGDMGPSFKDELIYLGKKYGEPLNSSLFTKFNIQNSTCTDCTAKIHEKEVAYKHRNQRASKAVLEYYTPRTLRRALEYFSIDYLVLGLPLPSWVDEILATET